MTQPPSPLTMLLSRHTRRREFITLLGGAAAWPIGVRAQQAERVRRIGVLMGFAADDLEGRTRLTAFMQALQQIGWTDGRNARIDTRWGGLNAGDIRKFATELVELAPDVILTSSSVATASMLQATRTIPIVFTIVYRPGRRRLCRQPGAAGWQCHRLYHLRIFDEREVAGAAQVNRPQFNASDGPS